MKIKMLRIARGPTFAADPGDVLDLPDGTARQLIAAGAAEAVEIPAEEEPPPAAVRPIEAAVVPDDAERAVAPQAPQHRPSGPKKGGRRK